MRLTNRRRRERKRHCYVCCSKATISDQRLGLASAVYADGTVRRGQEWRARFLCDEHADVNPWALTGS